MKKLIRVFAVLLVLSSMTFPLGALPPGECAAHQCLICVITIYSDGHQEPVSCGFQSDWGYCRCILDVEGGCRGDGNCYYHP